MNLKKSLYVIASALAFAGVSFGCSSDSPSGTNGDDGIDRGEINIPIPGDESSSSSSKAKPASSSSAPEAKSSSSGTQPASSAAEPGSSAAEAASSDWRDYCLEVVNAKRATEGLPPLARANEEREKCVTEQAAADMSMNKGHGNFGTCKESAQNSGPNINPKWYKTETEIVDAYVNMMWDDEKALVTSGERDPDKSEDYSYIGHYLNMKNTRFSSLACGIAYTEDGSKAWFNMNFY